MDTIITAPPRSVQVADIIRREITAGNLSKGQRLRSIREMAEKYSVTNQIVQSAFNILNREGLIETYVGCGTFVASNGRSLAAKTVLLIISGTEDKHNRMPVVLSSTLQKHGYVSYVFDNRHLDDKATLANIKALLKEKPKALVVTAFADFNFDIIKWLEPETRLLHLMSDWYLEEKCRHDASYIFEDYVEAGRRACEYLLAKGRRKIATVSFTRQPGWSSDLFISGVEQVLAEKKLKVFKYLTGGKDDPDFVEEFRKGGYPDGVFCTGDFYYSKVNRAAFKCKLALGKDFDAVGFGNTPWAEAFGIASLDRMEEKISKKVAEVLGNGKEVNLKIAPELVEHHGEHGAQLKSVISSLVS